LREKLQGAGAGGHTPEAMGHAEGRAIPTTTAGPRTRVIGVASGKGGVGKSSVTVNLAVSLALKGHMVGLLDADVYGFSIPKMLGLDQDPVQIDGMVIPPVGHGVKCISVGMLVESDETPVMWRGPMLHKLLEEFLTRVHWGEPDYLLFDMPPGTGDVALSMHNYLPQAELIVVTTPQAAAERVAQRSASMATKVGTPVVGIVENMSWFTGDDGRRYELFGSGGGQQLADKLGVALIGQVPFVPAVRIGGDVGVPIVVSDPDGEAARAFDSIATWVAAKGPKRRFRPELTIR
jgi:ATP-binding protein involved in chromosome partitioning